MIWKCVERDAQVASYDFRISVDGSYTESNYLKVIGNQEEQVHWWMKRNVASSNTTSIFDHQQKNPYGMKPLWQQVMYIQVRAVSTYTYTKSECSF